MKIIDIMGGYIDEGNFIQDWYSDEKKKYAENLLTRWFIIILKGDLVTNSNTNQ